MAIRINIIAAVAALALFVAASVAAAEPAPPATSDSGGSSVLTPFAAMSPEAQTLGEDGEAMDGDDFSDEDAASIGAPVASTEFPPVEGGGSATAGSGLSMASVATVVTGAVAGYCMF